MIRCWCCVARRLAATLLPVLLCALAIPVLTSSSVAAQTEGAPSLREQLAQVRASRPAGVPEASLTSIEYLLDVADRIERGFAPQSAVWRATAARYLEAARAGRDPYLEQGGRITNRGYRSQVSDAVQGYAVYLPPGYDPSRRYPLLIMLHGGSSNGNLFLGVVLGNNMDWLTYSEHLWDEYTPRWSPEWIVVAPDGFGQVLWRWMGEQDVLDVVDDVQRHYSVDENRVVLGGLSNGGVGAYAIGMRHAWRFSMVLAIAGAPSWLQYTGGSPAPEETRLLHQVSGMHLVENSVNTDFRFFHGSRDGGPMRPRYVQEMEAHMRGLGLEPQVRWYDHGHDLLYLVHRHGRSYADWAQVVRDPAPREVRVVTADYRANRQHWVTVTRIEDYPRLARVRAVAEDGAITAQTEHVLELALDLRDAPVGQGDALRIAIDGTEAYAGPRARLGHVIHLAREGGRIDGAWRLGFLPREEGRLEKVPGLSGPLTDPYRDGMIHVYGTQDAAATADLQAAAQRGARGWPLWLWQHQQRVVADTEVTDEMMRRSHLVLYGTPGANSVLERMQGQLPIRVTSEGVQVGERTYRGAGVGTRFVHPNPLAPSRYVIVQAAPTTAGVQGGHNLPDFLADWVVYDGSTTRTRQRLISGRNGQVAMGFFDRFWSLPDGDASASLGDRGGREAIGERAIDPRRDVLGGGEGEIVLAQSDAVDAPPPTVLAPPSDETPEQRARRLELNAAIGAPPEFTIPHNVLEQSPAPERAPAAIPEPPAIPSRFDAPARDPAGRIARRLAAQIPTFLNYRAIIPGGEWRVDRRAMWRIQPQDACYAALAEAGVPAQPAAAGRVPMPSPVTITGPIDGVTFRMIRPEDEPLTISCEMALRLRTIAAVARRHAVRAVDVLSAHRTQPQQSFHRAGLGLDLFAFETDEGALLSVYEDFVETPAHRTCAAPPPADPAARALLEIACELAASRQFSSVLTPNYNEGHRNHFHVDARPDDPRIFVR
ncbi:MAG: extensin family protein [Myxococcota bacterium]|nr:extensin family protein [Myxococcota bacterium]